MLSHWRPSRDAPVDGSNGPSTTPQVASSSSSGQQEQPEANAFIRIPGAHLAPQMTSAAASHHPRLNGTLVSGSSPAPTSMSQQEEAEAGEPSKKLWQSLVLPLVLASIIVLIALWTRQISLAVTNDTILMVMILMGLFIVMSGLAFWLSCDQYLNGHRATNNSDTRQLGDTVGGVAEAEQQSECHCQRCEQLRRNRYHHHHNSDLHHHRLQSPPAAGYPHEPDLCQGADGLPTPAGCDKCCSIQVIDCQPPDYYAALANSMPVYHRLLTSGDDNNGGLLVKGTGASATATTWRAHDATDEPTAPKGDDNGRRGNTDENGEEDEYDKQQRSLAPPSYEELQRERRDGGKYMQ